MYSCLRTKSHLWSARHSTTRGIRKITSQCVCYYRAQSQPKSHGVQNIDSGLTPVHITWICILNTLVIKGPHFQDQQIQNNVCLSPLGMTAVNPQEKACLRYSANYCDSSVPWPNKASLAIHLHRKELPRSYAPKIYAWLHRGKIDLLPEID